MEVQHSCAVDIFNFFNELGLQRDCSQCCSNICDFYIWLDFQKSSVWTLMSEKPFQKGFLQGCGCAFGVLSCPIIIFSLWGIFTPTMMSLQKKEYVDWYECYWEFFGSPESTSKALCGKRPKRWKWQ